MRANDSETQILLEETQPLWGWPTAQAPDLSQKAKKRLHRCLEMTSFWPGCVCVSGGLRSKGDDLLGSLPTMGHSLPFNSLPHTLWIYQSKNINSFNLADVIKWSLGSLLIIRVPMSSRLWLRYHCVLSSQCYVANYCSSMYRKISTHVLGRGSWWDVFNCVGMAGC